MKTRLINHLEGVNRGVGPHLLMPGEVTECENLYTDRIGEKKKRPGYAAFHDAVDANKVRSLYYFEASNATIKRAIRVSGTKVYASNLTGSAWGTAIHTLAGSTNPVSFAPLAGYVFWTDGEDTCQVYDGTTVTAVAAAPKGRWCATYQRRIYTWGVDGNPDRVYYSKLDDPTNWTITANDEESAGYWDVDPDNYGNLVGGGVINRKLTVFKEHKIYRFDGYAWDEVNTSEGLQSHMGLVQIEDFTIYPNRAGIYAFAGNPLPLSDYVKDYFEGVSDFNPLTQTLNAGKWGRHYLLSIGTVTDRDGVSHANAVLVYNQRLNQWFLWSFAHRPTAFMTYTDSAGVEQLAFGDSNGNCYTFNSGTTDAGTAIHSRIVIPLSTDVHQKYTLRHLSVVAKPAAGVTVSYSFIDNEWQELGGLDGELTRFQNFPSTAEGFQPKLLIKDEGSANYNLQAIHLGYEEERGEWYK